MADDDDIRDRLEAILREGGELSGITIAGLIAQAEEVRVKAMAAGDCMAAIEAIREKGILSGLRVERREVIMRRADDGPALLPPHEDQP